MKNVLFSVFGLDIPVWIALSVLFVLIYVLFTALGAVRERKIKAKRNTNVKDNI